MSSNRKMSALKRLVGFAVFCIFYFALFGAHNSSTKELQVKKAHHKTKKFRYLRYRGEQKPVKQKKEPKTFWPMPKVVVIDFDAYVQRAENLCGEYNYYMSEIEATAGNPEMAMQICLQNSDYSCAFRIALKYQGSLSYKSEYDPYNILRRAEEDEDVHVSKYWLADGYEKIKVLDKAEQIYKEMGDEYGVYYDLLDFYLRQNFFVAAKRLVDEDYAESGGYSSLLNTVINAGKLKETGLYGMYLNMCREEPDAYCFGNIDANDVTANMVKRAWDSNVGYSNLEEGDYADLYGLALIAKAARDSGLTSSYVSLVRDALIKRMSGDGWMRPSSSDYRAMLMLNLENDVMPHAVETYNANIMLGEISFYDKNFEKAYGFFEKSDTRGVIYALELASSNKDTEAAQKFARLLLKGNDKVMKFEGTGSSAEGDAYIALGEWDKAMDNCEWGMGTDNFAPYGSCRCAVEVVQGLQKELKEEE